MNGFYVSLVFLGAILVIFSLACVFLDKKKVFNFIKSFDDKKQELIDILNDAEQMIEELNKFSDYIVNQMDLKNEELSKNLKLSQDKVNVLSEKARSISSQAGTINQKEVTECTEAVLKASAIPAASEKAYSAEEPAIEVPAAVAVNGGVLDEFRLSATNFKFDSASVTASSKKVEKVVPINNKYSEVIRLSQEGMQSLEIAKRLYIGKGEVELILGLRK